MATASENSDIAVLQTEMKSVKDAVLRIETKLDAYNMLFVTRNEFVAFKKQYWLSHTLTALVSAALAGLLFWFFNHGGH